MRQPYALQFTRGALGNLAQKIDPVGHFESRQFFIHEVAQFPFGYQGAIFQDNDGGNIFAQLVMGNGKGQGLLNGSVIKERLVDFGGSIFSPPRLMISWRRPVILR